jgi:hypothetical protein
MISEAKLSALIVALLAGAGLLMVFGRLLGFWYAMAIIVPVIAVMATVMLLFASDIVKKGGDGPPKGK